MPIAKRLIIWIEAKVQAAGFKKAQKEAKGIGMIIHNNGRIVDRFTGSTLDSAKAGKQLFFQTQRFRMELLSLMFGFMMLNKALMSFMKNLVLTYNKAFEEQDGFRRATDKLTAAWTFLKFALVDALMSSIMFRKFIDIMVKIVDWFGRLSKGTKTWIMWILIVLTALTGIGFVMASMGLFWFGIMKFMGIEGVSFAGVMMKVFKAIAKGLVWLAGAFKITFLWIAKNPVVLLILAIIAVATALVFMGKKMGGIGEFFKSVFRGIGRLGAIVAQGLADRFTNAANSIIGILNWIIDKVNSMIGLKWVQQVAKKLGITISPIGNITPMGTSNILGKYLDWEMDKLTPKQGYTDELAPWNWGGGAGATPSIGEPPPINIEVNYNIEGVADVEEMLAKMDEQSKKLIDDITRQMNATGY